VVRTTAGHLWDTRPGSSILTYLFLYAGYGNREIRAEIDRPRRVVNWSMPQGPGGQPLG